MTEEVREGSGNVFADTGVKDPVEFLAKAEIAKRIYSVIESRGLNQKEAAQVLGVDQAKVSALVNGRLSGFSTDRLFRFLTALDCDVEIVIRSKQGSEARIHVQQGK